MSQSGHVADHHASKPTFEEHFGTPQWADALETGSHSQITPMLMIIEVTLAPLPTIIADVAQKYQVGQQPLAIVVKINN